MNSNKNMIKKSLPQLEMKTFSQRVVEASVVTPKGRVTTYGAIAKACGARPIAAQSITFHIKRARNTMVELNARTKTRWPILAHFVQGKPATGNIFFPRNFIAVQFKNKMPAVFFEAARNTEEQVHFME